MIEPVRFAEPTTWKPNAPIAKLLKNQAYGEFKELKQEHIVCFGVTHCRLCGRKMSTAPVERNWKPYAVGLLVIIFYALWEVSRYGSNS